ncbi:hypothetical protein R3P38DRAFT_3282459 [Favolaschia claudopus]|uniref:Uncharacterized protein n=1 Tax=Favolaschia claudopus TaxID=2862362 RepID=A0AAW0ACX3_9AGAR
MPKPSFLPSILFLVFGVLGSICAAQFTSSPSSSPEASGHKLTHTDRIIVGVTVPVDVILIVIASYFCCCHAACRAANNKRSRSTAVTQNQNRSGGGSEWQEGESARDVRSSTDKNKLKTYGGGGGGSDARSITTEAPPRYEEV